MCWVAFLGTSAVCLGGSAVPLGGLGGPIPDWAPGSLPVWPSCNLTACPSWGGLLPAWEGISLAGVLVVTSLPAWEEALSPGVVLGLTALPAWEEVLSLERGKLPELLSACLPERPEMPLNCFLPQGEGEHLPDCLPGKLINWFLP